MLHRYRDDAASLKFKGKLSTSAADSTTELSKPAFEDELRRLIKSIGLQTFFYVPNSDVTEMIFIPDHAHKLTLQEVIDEFTLRLEEPDTVMTTDNQGN